MFSFPISEYIWPKCGYMVKQIVFGSFYHPERVVKEIPYFRNRFLGSASLDMIEAPSAVWPPFSGWLQKFRNTDIVSLASPRVILELPSVVFSVCQNHYQKLVFCWHVFWQMNKLQIHKLVSRCDHLNVSMMYSIFDWKEFEILSYRWAFLQSMEIRASEEPNALKKEPAQFLPLHKLSGKAPVQFMPFWKLSGKCHFLVRFCTSNWSETYIYKKLHHDGYNPAKYQ